VPFFDALVESLCFAKNKNKIKIFTLAGGGEGPVPVFHALVES
jgi:hypothetical protein